jgi:hypothetical protein
MPKFTVDLWLDGYDSEEEMSVACEQFIYNQLNFSGSGVKIMKIPSPDNIAKKLVNVQPMPERKICKTCGYHVGYCGQC